MSPPRVLIAGGGVAGLATALRLGRGGATPIVVEQAAQLPPGGFLVSLSERAHAHARTLDLLPELERRGAGIRRSAYFDGSGASLLELRYDRLFEKIDVVQLMRDELVAALFEKANGVADIRFERRISCIEPAADHVGVELSDGSSLEVDAVVGADGVHSATRSFIAEPPAVRELELGLGCAAYRLPNVLGITDQFVTHMRRDRYMAAFNTGGDDIGAVFVWDLAASGQSPADIAAGSPAAILRSAFAGSGGAIDDALAECPQDAPFYLDYLSQVVMDHWHRGPVGVIGDAAHCLTLFSGRGAGAAFLGGCELGGHLLAAPAAEAMGAFEAAFKPAIDSIQRATMRAVRWYVPRKQAVELLRNGAMALLPNALFRAYFRLKYSAL